MTIDAKSYLVDANVLVYAFDASEAAKQMRANAVLKALQMSGNGFLSVQVLGEFYRATTQRIKPPLEPTLALEAIDLWLDVWPVLPTTTEILRVAAPAAATYQLQIWDAVIWASAKMNGIQVLLSEDMQNGQTIDGVRIVNPLLDNFDLAQLA